MKSVRHWIGVSALVSVLTAAQAGGLSAGPAPSGGTKQLHWAFQPLGESQLPSPAGSGWARNPVDRFILSALEKAGMKPSPETDRIQWLRRVTFDLLGLPPTPEQIERFVGDTSDGAYERVVDSLLRSPRYGEQWAQHWLDVVRYADTHGFEVNTERPNAWPYRDYVIQAFNGDKPYNQFVREQIVGDKLGEDAATGFLVTASVLLPGQIGQDEPSKRLARQDSLDEIVVNLGQTFLGLSIGCARCHDHKFDPITQRDYYAMQAFVAGVEYEDRELQTPETERLHGLRKNLLHEKTILDEELSRHVPLARLEVPAHPDLNARQNVEAFTPVNAKFVRFTIHDAGRHPTLGVIEPCLDEIEVLTADVNPINVALASHGTRVTASGSRESGDHRLQNINDGKYGNRWSWMSDESGRGWVQFEFPETNRIGKVVWSRDREGKFEDRLATAYTLEAGESTNTMQVLVDVPPLRPPVNARSNVDRFAPVKAKRLRFTVRKTNRLEPCLDELEVRDPAGHNVALASQGTVARSSGDTEVPGRHSLTNVNDGLFGNSRSWMSNEAGRGWVELEFTGEPTIDRVVWGRDREGQYGDRLATEYLIEVAGSDGRWQSVASSVDRKPYVEGEEPALVFSTARLDAAELQVVERLRQRRKTLEGEIQKTESTPKVFGGIFRRPDEIHLLRRGDPEQPRDMVPPAIPAVLGGQTWTAETLEPERREALAEWIASEGNPLTARVMVNRIWQGHFGTGLVETSSDFGRNGARPSHPELLDWLAGEFIRSGWSVKQLHRLIVLSATYRQTSRVDEAALKRDADDRLLWRFPTRRLEAETIRDSLLATSGQLSSVMFGRGFDLFDLRGGLSGFKPVERYSGDGLKRMIYAHKVRREREAVFGAFDCPDAGQSTARRRESTTPIQALNLFNSRFTLDQAKALSVRVEREAGGDIERQVGRAWRIALGRNPKAEELRDAVAVVREHGLPTLCRALFNSNEFLFIP